MSFPLTLSTPNPATSFTLPKKRLRDLSGEDVHDLDVSTQDKRNKQLKIEIPPTSLLHDSWSSTCSTTASVKGSPTSAASEVDILFGEAPSIPHSRSATLHVFNSWTSVCSTTASVKGSPTSLFSAASEVHNSLFDEAPSILHSRSATSHLPPWSSACSTISIKGSPTSLFSAASEVDSLFDQVPSITHSRSATPHLPPWNSACPTTVSIKDSPTSLFSAMSEVDAFFDDVPSVLPHAHSATSLPVISDQSVLHPALLTAPPIQGLYFDPSLCLPQQVAESVMNFCLDTYFRRPGVNQVMLFGRAPSLEDSSSNVHSSNSPTGLPTVLIDLLSTLSVLLRPLLPEPTYTLLFPPTSTRARQAIINLYNPGEGISPHIDLLKRYGDGIIGVSLGSGCAMRFDREGGAPDHPRHGHEEQQRNRWDLYLPERSVLVLSEAARYEWTHGIDKRTRDYVSGPEYEQGADSMCLDDDRSISTMTGRWMERSVRLSVTFRWLLPGADVVGPPASN